MAVHGHSRDIAELELSLADMKITSQIEGDDNMIPLHTSQLESTIDSNDNDTSSDASFSPQRKPMIPRSRAKRVRKEAHQTQKSKPSLRPAMDILSRIRHDPALDPADFLVGYHDRHAPELMEMEVASWKGGADVTDEDWIPQHRIVYFRRKGDKPGRRIWDREKRLDRLFGSGIVVDEQEEQVEQVEQNEQECLSDELEDKSGLVSKASEKGDAQSKSESPTQKQNSTISPPCEDYS